MAKSPYQLWKEQQEREAKGQSTVPKAPYRAVQYSNPTYKGKSEEKSYKWETENLRSMKSSKNIRSYNDKFSNWAKNNGLSSSETKDFRTWLDSREDGVKTNTDFMSETLNSLRKRNQADAERIKNAPKETSGFDKLKNVKKKDDRNSLEKLTDFFKDKDVDGDRERDGLLGFMDRWVAPISKGATETLAPGNQAQMMKNNPDNPVTKAAQKDRGTETKVLNSIGAFGALAAPVGQSYKVANTVVNKIPSLAKIANPYAKRAVTGAIAGGVAEGGVSATNELVNPDAYNLKDHAIRTGIGVAGGAILDPAMYGAGRAIASIMKRGKPAIEEAAKEGTEQAAKQEILALPEPQLRLPAPRKAQSTLEGFKRVFKKPSGLNNPIPELPKKLSQLFNQERLQQQGLNFGFNAKNTPKARMDLSPVESTLDPLNRGQEYWMQRYEDFAEQVNARHDLNEITPEALEDLWSSFAKYDEPVRLEQVVDLAYPKGFEAPPKPEPPAPRTIKDDLREDPRINDLIKKLHPPKVETPPISRKATFQEMVDYMKQLAPPKKPEPSLEPLQFRRSAGGGLDGSFAPKKGSGFEKIQAKKDNGGSLKEQPSLNRLKRELSESITPKDYKKSVSEIENKLIQVKELRNKAKDNKTKEEYKTQLADLEKELKVSKEKDLLDSDVTFDDILQNSDEWKDKSKILYKRETMDRNFDDIMGDDAPLMKKVFIEPIKGKEAERIRFLNEQRKKVKGYGVKPGSKDDELVQMYGEKKIDLDELKKRTINWKNVQKTAESYRENYDKLLDQVNKVLVENDFDPIPKRKDYFPHFEEVDGLLKQFGFDMENHTLPTDINGLTANFKPSKNFFRNSLQRKGDQTDFGAAIGFDKYVEGISNVIYHTKNIKRLRALDKEIRNKYEGDTQLSNFAAELSEYTNILAGKKATIDRAAEDLVGRRAFNFLDTVRRRVSANMVGANLASAMTGYIPLTQAAATTNKKAFVRGMLESMTDVFRRDGLVQESDFLTKRLGSDPLYRSMWDKTVDKSMWFMKVADNFSSQAIVRGKYHEGIEKGLSHEQALKQADEWASKIIGDRSKGSMPTLMSSKTLGPVTQFQLEVNNQLSFLFKDMPRNMDKAALASGYAQVLLFSFAFNEMYEKLVGRRPAFDPIGVVMDSVKDYNNDNISDTKATRNTVERALNTMPFSSAFYGGRFPIEAAIPNFEELLNERSTIEKEALKPLTYLLPPTGGAQGKKIYDSVTNFGDNPLSPQAMPGQYQTKKNGDKVLRYPIESSPLKYTQSLLFGKNALSETNEYYENNRRILSVNQTKEVEEADNPIQAYNDLMNSRRINTLEKKMKDLKKEKDLTEKEKKEKLKNLLEQLRKVKEVN